MNWDPVFPWPSQSFTHSRLTDGGEVVSLMHRPPFSPRKIPGTHFCQRLSRPQGHSAAGRIRPIEKSSDLIENRTRDIPACCVVPQPTTLPRAPVKCPMFIKIRIQGNYSILFDQSSFRVCRVLTMVYNTQNYWIFGLFPSSSDRGYLFLRDPTEQVSSPLTRGRKQYQFPKRRVF
jgi:hypothetical protein